MGHTLWQAQKAQCLPRRETNKNTIKRQIKENNRQIMWRAPSFLRPACNDGSVNKLSFYLVNFTNEPHRIQDRVTPLQKQWEISGRHPCLKRLFAA